jgi:hypothetical protein
MSSESLGPPNRIVGSMNMMPVQVTPIQGSNEYAMSLVAAAFINHVSSSSYPIQLEIMVSNRSDLP